MDRDLRRYLHALDLARSHDSGGRFNMACTVYRGKKLIHVGFNEYPISRGGETIHSSYTGLGVHAELSALTGVLRTTFVSKLRLYIAGVNGNGTPITSKPCPRCNNMFRDSRSVDTICYFDGIDVVVKESCTLDLLKVPIYNERKLAC